MKELTLVLLGALVVQTSGFLIKVPTNPSTPTVQKTVQVLGVSTLQQKLVLPLFDNVCEISADPVIIRLSQEFNLDAANEDFWKPEVVSYLQNLKSTKGLLTKGEIFSEYIPDHVIELKAVYDILYQAKNFDTFYKAASWSRQNLNCGLFVSAIYMAVQNREDTRWLAVPAPYEVLPNYFIRKDVIVQAASLLAGDEITLSESIHNEGNVYTIDSNYTAIFYDNEDDSKLAYFREDIGLNSYYFLRKLKQLSLFDSSDMNNRCGENIYQMMKQFIARYNLERYANALPDLEGISWDDIPDVSYDPMLIYSNGNEFAHRLSSMNLVDNEDVALLRTIENNIATVVDHMRQSGFNKTQILNRLMEILVIGDRSYETLARRLLGKDHTNNGSPSILEHYMTSLRDPMFWKINQKIVDLVDDALKILPSYSRNELYFPGVEVLNVDVKKVMTAFDYYQVDVSNALKIDNASTTFQVKIGQPRLNHKPFSVKLNISSLVTQKGLVKIYLGPKMLPGELTNRRNMFLMMDTFEINLRLGVNIISRTSDQMKQFADDFISLKTLYKNVEDAEFGIDSLPHDIIQSQYGYPSRFILPKGTPQGLPLQIFVFVAPFVKRSVGNLNVISSSFNNAILSPGYPLDLKIEDGQLFDLPNALVKDIVVTQKGDNKIENYGGSGITKKWYSNYEPSTASGEGGGRPEPYDYKSKKGQYGNQDSYYVTKENKYDTANKNDETFQDASMWVLPAELSRQLYASRYDYSEKKTTPSHYESKRGQYEKSDYSNNQVHSDVIKQYSKMSDVTESTTKTIDDKNLNKLETPAPIEMKEKISPPTRPSLVNDSLEKLYE